MIRAFNKEKDLNRVMEIWLETNIATHDFIDNDFFKRNFDIVKIMMPASKIYVQEVDSLIHGFIGLMDNYIAGLFIDVEHQGKGFGRLLIEQAKKDHSELYTHVYKQNEKAIKFYKKQGFQQIEERLNEETALPELLMHCAVSHQINIGKCAL